MADVEVPAPGLEQDSALRSRLESALRGATPRPGVAVRLRYAGYLFMALLSCLVMRNMLGSVLSSIPYYRGACAVPVPDSITTPAPPTTTAASANYQNPIPGGEAGAMVSWAKERGMSVFESGGRYFNEACLQDTVVYRISFALFIFFLLHFVSVSDLTCCIPDDARAGLQTDFFWARSIAITFLGLISMAIPTHFFAQYAHVCLYASGLFLVLQIILVVDFAHHWSEEWAERAGTNGKWVVYLFAMTVLTFAGGVGALGYGFWKFTPHSTCNLHGFILITCGLLGLTTTAVAIWVPHGSILPSGMMFLYTACLVITALRVSTNEECGGKPSADIHNTKWWELLLSSLFTAGALTWSAVSVSGRDDAFDGEGGHGGDAGGSDDGALGHLPSFLYFYAVMMLASMYLAMLGSDWSVTGTADGARTGIQVEFWVRIGSSWFVSFVYLWTLLAPYFCCKHRDYGYDVPMDWR
jgi:hypothetical protein